MARPTALTFVGALDNRGEPRAWLLGIPGRDLDAGDLAQLSDEQIAEALASGLYEAPKQAKAAAAAESEG